MHGGKCIALPVLPHWTSCWWNSWFGIDWFSMKAITRVSAFSMWSILCWSAFRSSAMAIGGMFIIPGLYISDPMSQSSSPSCKEVRDGVARLLATGFALALAIWWPRLGMTGRPWWVIPWSFSMASIFSSVNRMNLLWLSLVLDWYRLSMNITHSVSPHASSKVLPWCLVPNDTTSVANSERVRCSRLSTGTLLGICSWRKRWVNDISMTAVWDDLHRVFGCDLSRIAGWSWLLLVFNFMTWGISRFTYDWPCSVVIDGDGILRLFWVWLLGLSTLKRTCLASDRLFPSVSSDRKVSAGLGTEQLWPEPDMAFADLTSWLTSRRNKPLDVNVKPTGTCSMGLVKVLVSQLIWAFSARISVLLMRNGVPPGTTAIFHIRFPKGNTMACWLVNVAWFPNLNVMLQLVLLRPRLVDASRLWINSGKQSLPITVLEAPKSSTPHGPWEAKQACSWALSDAYSVQRLDSWHLFGWLLRRRCTRAFTSAVRLRSVVGLISWAGAGLHSFLSPQARRRCMAVEGATSLSPLSLLDSPWLLLRNEVW